MGYTNYLKIHAMTAEQFDLLCDVSAEAFGLWERRFAGARESLSLDNFYVMLMLSKSQDIRRGQIFKIGAEWRQKREILISFEDCESIRIEPDKDFIFCKTRKYEPQDTLAVAIFWLAQLIAESATFGSDGYKWETAEGRAFAEYIWKTSKARRIFEEKKENAGTEEN